MQENIKIPKANSRFNSVPMTPEERTAHYDAIREERRQEQWEAIREASAQATLLSVPPLFRGKTFDDFKVDYPAQHKVKNIAMRFVKSSPEIVAEGKGLEFLGVTGTGKTLLAQIISQELLKLRFSVRYESTLQFLRILHDKNFESNTVFQNILDRYKRIDFLIIDEITEGIVKGGELANWELEMLFAVVDMRYTHQRPIIAISNQSKEMFIKRLGNRIASRLLEKSLLLAFDWHPYR